MGKSFLRCVLCFSLALFAVASLPRDVGAFPPGADLDDFMQTYSAQPTPDRIDGFIKALGEQGFLKQPSAVPPVGGFLSEVFLANPARVEKWKALAKSRDPATQSAVALAATLSTLTDGALGLQKISAQTNDIYWGAYFASNKRAYIDKLIGELVLYDLARYPHKSTTTYFDNTEDYASFFAGWSAQWSLAANLARHPEINSIVQEAQLKATGRSRDLLLDVQTKSPDQIKADVASLFSKPPGAM
jgi:hypothetical protein